MNPSPPHRSLPLRLGGSSWSLPSSGWALGGALALHGAVVVMAMTLSLAPPRAGADAAPAPANTGWVVDAAFLLPEPPPRAPLEATAEVSERVETPTREPAEIRWPPLAPERLAAPEPDRIAEPLPGERPFVRSVPPLPLRRSAPVAVAPATPAPAHAAGPLPSTPAPQPRVPARPSAPGVRRDPRPLPQGQPAPEVPALADARGWHGTTVLRLAIDVRGRVSGARVVRSSGHRVLDAAAARATRAWRFAPATVDGRPVPGHHLAVVRFPRR